MGSNANSYGSIRERNGYNENTNDQDGTETNETHRQNDAKVNKEKEKPWKLVIQNMEGLVTEKSKEKVELLKEYTEVDNIILMNLTETWFDNTVEDVVEIEGYNIFRGDRKEIERGGTAIYLHDKLEQT